MKIVNDYINNSLKDCNAASSLIFSSDSNKKTAALAYANKSLSNLSVAVSIAYSTDRTISDKYKDIFDQIEICNRSIIEYYADPSDKNGVAVKSNTDILINMKC